MHSKYEYVILSNKNTTIFNVRSIYRLYPCSILLKLKGTVSQEFNSLIIRSTENNKLKREELKISRHCRFKNEGFKGDWQVKLPGISISKKKTCILPRNTELIVGEKYE